MIDYAAKLGSLLSSRIKTRKYHFGRFLTLWRDKSPYQVNARFGTQPRDEIVPWWPLNWIVISAIISLILLWAFFSTGKYFLERRLWFLRRE